MNRRVPILLSSLLSLAIPGDGFACTLYGAIGTAIEGGGVLVGKTRDLWKGEEQVLLKETASSGLAYIGLASRKDGRLTAGLNEKGLVIANASAVSVAARPRRHLRIEKVLCRARTVEEALKIFREEGMKSPIHYLLADQKTLALLEVYSLDRYEIKKTSDGVLFHTNHYLLPSMRAFNGKMSKSSAIRLERIQVLLKDPPFTISKFISLAQDHGNGPGDLSICRHRPPMAKSGGITVSAIVFALGDGKPPEIWFRLGQPCEGTFEKASF